MIRGEQDQMLVFGEVEHLVGSEEIASNEKLNRCLRPILNHGTPLLLLWNNREQLKLI
jgi:hypothetical protein